MRGLFKLAAAAALALAPFAAAAQDPIVIKFSHVVTPDTPKGKGAEKFKELAEKYTNGRVKVEVYPNSQLYKDKEEVEALQLGAVQMLAPSLAKFGPLGAREFEVFDLPFILPSKAALRKVTEGDLGKRLFKKLEPKGIVGLGLLGQRLQGHERQQAAAHAGGFPRPEDAHPVLEGARGADAGARRDPAGDGLLGGLSGAADRRRRRLREHAVEHVHAEASTRCRSTATLSDHGYIGYAVIANKKFWDGLPGRCARPAREGDGRGDCLREPDLADGERRGAGGDEEVGQDASSSS